MQILNVSGLRASTLTWQRSAGNWTLTVICKATFVLAPGTVTLAPVQDPIVDKDAHWDGNPQRSLHAASDNYPLKLRPEFYVVGSAHAPLQQPTRSVVVRVKIGKVDKAAAVHCDRVFALDGGIVEGGPFLRMPLVYERTTGGPATSNPAGMHDLRDNYRRQFLPNIQPVDLVARSAADFTPVGFGPIAPSWPSRAGLLGPQTSWSVTSLREQPLPEAFAMEFFNVAPPDQRLDTLRDHETIYLENLHPEHARMTTTLPNMRPAVFFDAPGRTERVAMVPDTLIIDTDRFLLSVVFRGQRPLVRLDEPGRIVVAKEQGPQTLTWSDVVTLLPTTRTPTMRPPVTESQDETAVFATGPIHEAAMQQSKSVLPFQASATGSYPIAPVTNVAPEPSPSGTPAVGIAQSNAPPALRPPPAPPAFVRPAAPPKPTLDAPTSPFAAGLPNTGVSPAVPGLTLGAAAAVTGSRWATRSGPAIPTPEPTAQPAPAAAQPIAAPAQPPPPPKPHEIVQLIWFDTDAPSRIRRRPAFRPILDELEKRPMDGDIEDRSLAGEMVDPDERREVYEVLTRGEPTSPGGVRTAFFNAARETGAMVSPIVLCKGDVEMPFDELETLRAAMVASGPHVTAADKELKQAVDAAKEFLALPGLTSAPPNVSQALFMNIRDAFAREKKALPADYLEKEMTQMLLNGRHYQKRTLMGESKLRFLVRHQGEEGFLVGYLPVKLAKDLPMYKRFSGRLLAEVRLSEDQYETGKIALKALAIARVEEIPAEDS